MNRATMDASKAVVPRAAGSVLIVASNAVVHARATSDQIGSVVAPPATAADSTATAAAEPSGKPKPPEITSPIQPPAEGRNTDVGGIQTPAGGTLMVC